jgi:predicted GNAT family acetyltransferase
MNSEQLPAVVHNAAHQRYELTIDGLTSVMNYEVQGDVLALTHTGVPEAQRGRGLANYLVRSALDDIRARGLRIAPYCSFVRLFLRRHPEYADLVAR